MRGATVVLMFLVGTISARPPHGGPGGPGGLGSSEEADMMRGFHHEPPFAREASQEAKDALIAILKDESLTRQQLEEKVDAWANQQGGNVLTAYNEFKTKVQSMASELLQKIESSSLSDNIKSIAKQLQEIYNDKNQPIKASAEKAKALLAQLSEDDKKAVHNFFKDQFPRQKRQAGGRLGPGLMDKIKVPEFLGKATAEARQAFKTIITNKDLNKQQLIDQITAWANNQGDEIKNLFQTALQKMNEVKETFKTKIASSAISAEAKSALNELLAIFENMGITLQQEMEMRKAVMEKQSETTRKEMMQFLAENLKL